MEMIVLVLIIAAMVFLGGTEHAQSEELVAVVKGEEPRGIAGCSGWLFLAFAICCLLALLIVLGGGLA